MVRIIGFLFEYIVFSFLVIKAILNDYKAYWLSIFNFQ